jgi:hypothetical protein
MPITEKTAVTAPSLFKKDCICYIPADRTRPEHPEEHCKGYEVPMCFMGCMSYADEKAYIATNRRCIGRMREIGHPLSKQQRDFLKKYGEEGTDIHQKG